MPLPAALPTSLALAQSAAAPGDRHADGPCWHYRVRLQHDGEDRTWYLAPGSHWIGRAADCRICLEHGTVSRHHLQVQVQASGGALLIDTQSTNGTWLGIQRIRSFAINGGFELRLGAVDLTFEPWPEARLTP